MKETHKIAGLPVEVENVNPWANPWESYGDDWNLLDGISTKEIFLTISCNVRDITEETVEKEIKNLINYRLLDAQELLKQELKEITKRAKAERANHENN